VGGLWASGYSGNQIEALSEGSDWEDVGAFAVSLQGFFTNRRLREQLERFFGGRPIERWPRTFAAVATDLATGTRRVLDRGDGALAIQASTAVPVIFTPVQVRGERLADGALVEPVPAFTARGLGAQFVLAVDVAYRPYEEEASGITGFAFQAMHILVNSLAAEQAREADYFLRMDLHHRLMKCGGRSLIAAGRDALHAAWPGIERAMRDATRRASASPPPSPPARP
jgi:NTE family protein